MTPDQIDFAALYREAMQCSRLVPKSVEACDSRAPGNAGQPAVASA